MSHPLSVQAVIVGKSQWQKLEAAARTAPTARKQRVMNHGAQIAFSFLFSQGLSPREWMLPHSHARRYISIMVLNPTKLTRLSITLPFGSQ